MPSRPAAKPPRPLLGPTCGPELASIGLETVEDLRELGWEEVCIRWVEAFPLRLNVNAFCGVVAAIEGVDWRELDEGWRRRARALRHRLVRTPDLVHAARPTGRRAGPAPAARPRAARPR